MPPIIHYAKPFSRGQITIPKKIRQKMDMDNIGWVRMELVGDTLTITPEKSKQDTHNKKAHLKNLESIDGSWFDYDQWKKDNKKMRQEIEERLAQYDL